MKLLVKKYEPRFIVALWLAWGDEAKILLSMNRFVYCPGGIVMFDRPKNSMLGPLPGVNQSRKYLRTFLCHRISFCPFSSSPFLAKKDMYKSLSLPSGVDSALRSCVTKREKWLEIHITVPSTINKLRIWYHVFVKQPGLRMTGTAASRKQE